MNVTNHDQENNKVIMIKRNRKISKANEWKTTITNPTRWSWPGKAEKKVTTITTKNHGQESNKVITTKKSKKESHEDEHLKSWSEDQ
jgi:hypothetical protein